jgi:hypothetical protein
MESLRSSDFPMYGSVAVNQLECLPQPEHSSGWRDLGGELRAVQDV